MIELAFPSAGLDSSIDLTDSTRDALREAGVSAGFITVFARGSSVAVVVMRYEPGTIRDLRDALERVAPIGGTYIHELTTGDRNGFAHVRSEMLGTSVQVPWNGTDFPLSAEHRIVLLDFDLQPADRTVFIGK